MTHLDFLEEILGHVGSAPTQFHNIDRVGRSFQQILKLAQAHTLVDDVSDTNVTRLTAARRQGKKFGHGNLLMVDWGIKKRLLLGQTIRGQNPLALSLSKGGSVRAHSF
jgi:hypothetical protein